MPLDEVALDRDYPGEVRLWLPWCDRFICFEDFGQPPKLTRYIRFIDEDGKELVYWCSGEWKEEPLLVMGAIMGCLQNGA